MGAAKAGIMMFETLQMTSAEPNILFSVPLHSFIIVKFYFIFIKSRLSSRRGDCASHGSSATTQGLERSALGTVEGGRHKSSIKDGVWPV